LPAAHAEIRPIAFNYGSTRSPAFDLHRRQKTTSLESPVKRVIGGASTQSLLKLDIARSSVNIQQHAAISYLALNMVLGQRALSCDLVVIEPQRP
jgi:hypothetical protein